MSNRRVVTWAGLVAALGFILDSVSKYLVVEHLNGRPAVEVIGPLVKFTYVRNAGAAFGTGTSFTPVITVIALVAGFVTLRFIAKAGTIWWATALGLLMAGILGNLADRLFRDPGPFRGHVVDFIQLPHYAVFNVADMCINVAAVIIVVQMLRGIHVNGSRSARPQVGDSAEHHQAGTEE